MVYAYDKWIELPTKDIYDTQMMLASINAAKDMYDKGQAAVKDFYKTYGDFTSPFRKDMEAYDAIVNKPVRDMMNYMYENGIDPLRSAEGRAAIMQLINTVPTGAVNQLRESAETGKEYQKNLAALQAKGLYDPAQEQWRLNKAGVPSFDDFSTLDNGVWGQVSPMERGDLFELTNPSIKDIKDIILTKADVDKLQPGVWKPGRNYMGVREDDLLNVINERMPGLKGDPRLGYFIDDARNRAMRNLGPDATPDQIEAETTRIFANDVLNANHKHVGVHKEEVDPYAMAAYSARLSAMHSGSGGGGKKSSSGNGTENGEFSWLHLTDQKFSHARQARNSNVYNNIVNMSDYYISQHGNDKDKRILNWWKGVKRVLTDPNKTQDEKDSYLKQKHFFKLDENGQAVGFSNDVDRLFKKYQQQGLKLDSNQYYGQFAQTSAGEAAKVFNDYFYQAAGVKEKTGPLSDGNGGWTTSGYTKERMDLSKNGWSFTPVRRQRVGGYQYKGKLNTYVTKFNKFIKQNPLYNIGSMASDIAPVGNMLDIYGQAMITTQQLDRFFSENNIKFDSNRHKKKIIENMGLTPYDEDGYQKGYVVPITVTVDPTAYGDMNAQYIHLLAGQTSAGNLQPEAMERGDIYNP